MFILSGPTGERRNPVEFEMKHFRSYSKAAGLKIGYSTYWPFALSIPILAVRQWQKFRIKRDKIGAEDVDSDVKFPGGAINTLLKTIVKTESFLLHSAPFGSSLFMTMKPL